MKQALWKAYNSFSRKERLGILFLLVLTGCCVMAPALWMRCFPPAEEVFTADSLLLVDVAGLRFALTAAVPEVKRPHRRDSSARSRRFRPRWDISKVRYAGISREMARSSYPLLDINTADSALWEALPGIGPVLAGRIVRFRDKLGGFYAISQIGETYGLPDSTFNKIQPYLRLTKVSLKKLDLNRMDEKSLARHPYIRYKLARLIVLYRSNHGPFSRPEELLGIPLVNDSIYRKIEHYIKTENSPI